MSSAHSGSGGIFAAGNGSSVTGGGPALAEGNRNNYNTFFTADEVGQIRTFLLFLESHWTRRITTLFGVSVNISVCVGGFVDADVPMKQSLRLLMRTSDNIGRTRRTVAESEEMAKNVLVDLELQHSQLHEMHDKVSETSGLTGQVRRVLHMMATRSRRKMICLYLVIAALAVTDMLVFYLLFVR